MAFLPDIQVTISGISMLGVAGLVIREVVKTKRENGAGLPRAIPKIVSDISDINRTMGIIMTKVDNFDKKCDSYDRRISDIDEKVFELAKRGG